MIIGGWEEYDICIVSDYVDDDYNGHVPITRYFVICGLLDLAANILFFSSVSLTFDLWIEP
jgi:hypothetical protein